MIAYRSRALAVPSAADLESMVRQARERNRTLGLTGVLIYDQGYFFQWLEGPRQALAPVWDSICRDARHGAIEVLRDQHLAHRFFASWDMRLARRVRGPLERVLVDMEAPQALLGHIHLEPSALPGGDWDRLFANVVVPRLKAAHAEDHAPTGPERRSMLDMKPVIWHAHREAGKELAAFLLAVDSGATAQFINQLVAEGAHLDALYREVFEPAARFLGGLWDDDSLDEVGLTLGLARLQVEVRRLSACCPIEMCDFKPGHAVLIAPPPGEPHGLDAAMSSELFWRDGWEVSCEFPASDRGLGKLLHERWYDVLELTLSSALRRDQQQEAMGATIRAAQAASLNPALAVLVCGRMFFERPQAYRAVGADAACLTVIEAVPTAQRLLDTSAARGAAPKSGAARPRGGAVATAGLHP